MAVALGSVLNLECSTWPEPCNEERGEGRQCFGVVPSTRGAGVYGIQCCGDEKKSIQTLKC